MSRIDRYFSYYSVLIFISFPLQPCDFVDPIDYEDFIQQYQMLIDRHPLRSIIDFPSNDIQVFIEPKKMRTKQPILPKEPL